MLKSSRSQDIKGIDSEEAAESPGAVTGTYRNSTRSRRLSQVTWSKPTGWEGRGEAPQEQKKFGDAGGFSGRVKERRRVVRMLSLKPAFGAELFGNTR